MKIKRLLISLLVSILVITSFPIGVLAYDAMDDEKIYEKTGGSPLVAEGYVKLTSRNEIIPQALTERNTFFTTDFSAIYTVPAFNTRVTDLAAYTSADSNYSGSFRRIMTLHTDGKTNPAEFTIEYITDVTYGGGKYNVDTATESAANMFYFSKYPDTFPIKDFITYNAGDGKPRQIYVRYSDSNIKDVNVTTREKLGKANAIYAGTTSSGLTLSSYKDKVCWYFDLSNKTIVYGTSDGSTIPSPATISYEEWHTAYVVPTVSERLTNENIKVEESETWTDKNFVFVINQTKLAPRNQSCWTCAQEAIVMNSGCLNKTLYQMTGVVKDSSHKGWVKWSEKMGVSATATGPVSFNAVIKSNDLCTAKGSWTQGSSGDIDATAGSSGGAYIIGWNNNGTTQYIKDMSEQQLQTIFKSFYNSGYWLTIGLRNYNKPTHAAKPNGQEDEFTSNHTVMFAGIDNSHIMILDSASYKEGDGSKVTDYIYDLSLSYETYNKGDKSHNVVYIMAFKFSDEKNSLKAICGGADAYMTEADQYNLQNMGINNKKGYFTEDQLSSKVVLSEADLAGILADATLDNLTQSDLESLDSWKDIVEEESMVTKVIRIIVQVIGVLMLMWAILLYLGYHFDRINNLLDISVVHILTLGRLRPVTSDSEEPTFGKDKSEKKNKVSTVNSRNILAICLTVALFAVLILTGAIYNILASLVNLINSFLRR